MLRKIKRQPKTHTQKLKLNLLLIWIISRTIKRLNQTLPPAIHKKKTNNKSSKQCSGPKFSRMWEQKIQNYKNRHFYQQFYQLVSRCAYTMMITMVDLHFKFPVCVCMCFFSSSAEHISGVWTESILKSACHGKNVITTLRTSIREYNKHTNQQTNKKQYADNNKLFTLWVQCWRFTISNMIQINR